MADETTLLDIQTEDDGGLGKLAAQVNDLSEALATLDNLTQRSNAAIQLAEEQTAQWVATWDELSQAFQDSQLQKEIDQMVQLAQAEEQAKEQAALLAEQIQKGYGVEGGAIGPSAPDTGGGGGDGGGNGSGGGEVGSLLGVGRAFRGAQGLGTALGVGGSGFGDVASLTYLIEGFRRIDAIIPEVGAAMDAAGVSMAGLGAAVAAVAIPVGIAVAAFVSLSNQLKELDKDVKTAETEIERYYKLVHTGTETTVQKQLETDKITAGGIDASIAAIKGKIADLTVQMETDKSFGAAPAAALGILALNGQLKDLQDKAYAAQTAVADDNKALADSTVVANTAAEAVRAQADANIKLAQQVQADEKLTLQGAQDKAAQLRQDNVTLQQNIDMLEFSNKSLDQSSDAYKQNEAKIREYSNALVDNGIEIYKLTDIYPPLIQARMDEADAIKGLTKEATEAAAAQTALAKAEYDAVVKNHDAIAAAEIAAADQRLKIALDAGRKEQDIEQQTADAIVNIRIQESNKEQQALLNYQNQLADDQTKYNDEIAKDIRDEQRAEQKDAIDHQQRLRDIAQSARDNEENDLLDRNFLALYKDQEKQKQQVATEDQHYAEQEAALRRHLAQTEEDQAIALQQEEAKQALDYQRKLAADQLAAQQQIEQQDRNEAIKERDLQTSENRQLADLQTGLVNKETLINSSLSNELTMYQNNFDLRMQILNQERQQYLALLLNAAGVGGNVSGGGLGGYASGGSFSAGQPFTMSEQGPEALTLGRDTYNVSGTALVYPLQSGSVTPNATGNGPVSIHAPITITGVNDPQAVAMTVNQEFTKMLDEIFVK